MEPTADSRRPLRQMKFFPAFCLALLAIGIRPLGAATDLPLQENEHLKFRVSWAILGGAGEIKIDALRDPKSDARLVVTTTTRTRGIAKLLLPFEAQASSTFDLATGKLVLLHETSKTRKAEDEHTVEFDHVKREALYEVPGGEVAPRTLPIPPGDPLDLIMALMQTRSWDLQPGEKRESLVLFTDDFYELTIHFLRHEQVTTPLGTFQTIVMEPRMDRSEPKGMFRRGSTVRIWVSQDAYRLPVKFDVEFKIGTGTAVLESYQAPASTAKPAPSHAPDSRS